MGNSGFLRTQCKQLLLAHPGFARILAKLLLACGLRYWGTEIQFFTGIVTYPVQVRIPDKLNNLTANKNGFLLDSMKGKDLIARIQERSGWKSFERPMPDLLALFANCSRSFLDVGANTGFYSLLAQYMNPDIQVFAFEPFPQVVEILNRNLTLNKGSFRIAIETIQKAVSETDGQAALYVPSNYHGLIETSCTLSPTTTRAYLQKIEVETLKLDTFVLQKGISAVDLIKVDVEGFEEAVLRGAHEVLSHFRPVLFVEFLQEANFSWIENYRLQLKYRSFQLFPRCVIEEMPVQYSSASWNHLFIPEEKVPLLRNICKALRLKMEERL